MFDTEAYIRRLVESNPLREPLLRSIVEALHLPEGSHGLDAGCGVGLQTLLLADAVGTRGHVTGLDISPELLRYAVGLVRDRGLSDRISFRLGDVGKLPFSDNTFDWVWSADCVGYPAGDLLPVLRELARVVKPGGTVAILGWTAQNLLPGYPALEAQLNALCSAFAPYLIGKPPESHFLRAPGPFREAGLERVEAQTYAGDIRAPLHDDARAALVSLFGMLWGQPEGRCPPGMSPEGWADYRRLCDPTSPHLILDLPDYYAFFTYTMFQGKVCV